MQMISLNEIHVPEIRITSSFDEELALEIMASIKERGLDDPIRVWNVEGNLVLSDGLHRCWSFRQLGESLIPGFIRPGTMEDVIRDNIVHARQRGRSNPVDEGKMLRLMVVEYGRTTEEAAASMGMKPATARQLIRLTTLPEEVQMYVKQGRIKKTGAYAIVLLGDPEKQLEVGRDAVNYEYTAQQVQDRVRTLMHPEVEGAPGGFVFGPEGMPTRIPYTCDFCGVELGKSPQYKFICPQCYSQLKTAWAIAEKEEEAEPVEAEAAEPSEPPSTPPRGTVPPSKKFSENSETQEKGRLRKPFA